MFKGIGTSELVRGEYPNAGASWRQVLQYAVDGNLQAVLDEFAYLIPDMVGASRSEPDEAIAAVADTVRHTAMLRTARREVPRRMGQPRSVAHYLRCCSVPATPNPYPFVLMTKHVENSALAEEVPPHPSALIESMRALGYSLPSAVADLIDNSISAGARTIDVHCEWAGADSWIAVIDDGAGMAEGTLVEAMRLGSSSASEERAVGDLGRFGLGLKTASFSQARSLTVCSKQASDAAAQRRWDLDLVVQAGQWRLLNDRSGAAPAAFERLAGSQSGTVVLLESLDRLSGSSDVDAPSDRSFFLRRVAEVEQHLEMVFHRFMAGKEAITFRVNGNVVVPWDPFAAGDTFVESLPSETFTSDKGSVVVRPYVLPHFSRLDPASHARAAGPAGWNHQQGFYIYREGRLLVAGSWLGLPRMTQEEHYKLARVCVDLPNGLDYAWDIDVRKAVARIPRHLLEDFTRIARATRKRAAEAYRFRGRRLASPKVAEKAALWEVRKKGGEYSYRLDRTHPAIQAARPSKGDARGTFDRALRIIEETIPVAAIVMDAREHPDTARGPFHDGDREVANLLAKLHEGLVQSGASPAVALGIIATREPFDQFPEVVAAFRERELS